MNSATIQKRKEIIKKLKYLDVRKIEARWLMDAVKEECGILIKNPENASSYQINHYNELVMGSDLPLPERQSLLMQ